MLSYPVARDPGLHFADLVAIRYPNLYLTLFVLWWYPDFLSASRLDHDIVLFAPPPLTTAFFIHSWYVAYFVSARLKKLAAAGRETFDLTQAVCLPDQIHGEADLVCFEQCKAAPNFVSCKKVRGPVTALSPKTRPDVDLGGKIVLTPNADPGFDWIFSRGIAGLVTMYGGTNSHMAIRAAEFQLPAATGIGEGVFGGVGTAAE